MKLFETKVKKMSEVPLRVRANSEEEAEKIFREFNQKEGDYISEELDLNAEVCVWHEAFAEVHPTYWDECATITKNDDGTFDAQYEGGTEDD